MPDAPTPPSAALDADRPAAAGPSDGADFTGDETTTLSAVVIEVDAPPSTIAVPAKIGGVRLVRMLGRGGMGEVYLGRHLAFDLDVAVKLVTPHVADQELFLAEARAAARIAHPHVVRVLHAGRESGRLFLVMELMPGGDLASLVRDRGRIAWRDALALALQAAEGLGALHRAGFVHRDVKPANCMISADGLVKIADLGLARRLDTPCTAYARGLLLGTPAYMAPEQACGDPDTGPAADVYALGVSLFQLISGRMPYAGQTTERCVRAHAQDPVPDIRRYASVPDPVAALVERMLAKRPGARPCDGAAVAAELRSLIAVLGPHAQPQTARPREDDEETTAATRVMRIHRQRLAQARTATAG